MEQTNTRDYGLDILRLLSIAGIIVVHLCGLAFGDLPKNGFAFQSVNFYDGLFRFAVPCFVMISGALMLDPKREIGFKELYGKRILRFLIAWIAWSFLYAARFLLMDLVAGNAAHLDEFCSEFLNGHYHLWFVPMMIGLYAALPLLRPVAADRKLLRYFLILSFAVTILLPTVRMIGVLDGPVGNFVDRFMLNMPYGYVFYFMLGYYLYTEETDLLKRLNYYVLGFMGLLGTIVGTGVGNLLDPAFGDRLYAYLSLFPALLSIGVFTLVRALSQKRAPGPRAAAFLTRSSRYAFGIYLVHEYFNIVFPHFGIYVTSLPPVVMIPILTAVTYAGSYLISAALHRIPVLKDYLV